MTTHETALLHRWLQNQDAEAFAALVTRYSGLVYGTCRRMLGNAHDAQDAAQQCFMRLAQADGSSITYLGGWLHRVAANLCRDHAKREMRRRSRESAYVEAVEDAGASLWDDLQHHIDEAIEALSEGSRFAIQAHFLEGRTHDDIAQELGITRSAVTHRIERGIKQVRDNLRDRGMLIGVPGLAISMEQHLLQEAPPAVKAALGRLAVAGPAATVKGAGMQPSWSMSPGTLIAGAVALALVAVVTFALLRNHGTAAEVKEPMTGAAEVFAHEARVDVDPTGAATAADRAATSLLARKIAVAKSESNAAPGDGPDAVAEPVAEAATQAPPQQTETVTVRCVDTNGAPMAGAEVYLVQTELRSPPMQFPSRPEDLSVSSMGPVISGSDGIARFQDVPAIGSPNRHDFRMDRNAYARIPGKAVGAMARDQARSLTEDELSLTMVPSIQVSGKITVPEGFAPTAVKVRVMSFHVLGFRNPQFGAFSHLDGLEWRSVLEAVPDVDGNFTIADMPSDGAVYLAAEGPGLAQAQFAGMDSANLGPVEIAMTKEAAIEGRLSFGEDDSPAAGFTVLARPEHGPVTMPISTQTQQDGTFRAGGLSAGRYHVSVTVGEQPSNWNCAVRDVTVAAGETIQDIQLVLEEGQVLSGAVRESVSGDPIGDVMVVGLYGGMGGEAIASTVTEADGTYRFRMPAGEALLYVAGIPEGYIYPKDQGRKSIRIVPNADEMTGVDFQLARDPAPVELGTATVYGRAVDADGNPLPAVAIFESRVEFHGEQKMQTSGKVTNTNEDGIFAYETRTPCTSSFRVGGLGYLSQETDEVELKADDEVDLGDLVVELLSGEVAGIIVDSEGKPVSGAQIAIYGERFSSSPNPIVSDADGAFYALGVPEWELTVWVEKPGYEQTMETILPGQQSTITLKPMNSTG